MEVEPFGQPPADIRSGIVASVIANCNRNPDTHPQPFTATDFMPDYGGLRAWQEQEEQDTERLNQKSRSGSRTQSRSRSTALDQWNRSFSAMAADVRSKLRSSLTSTHTND